MDDFWRFGIPLITEREGAKYRINVICMFHLQNLYILKCIQTGAHPVFVGTQPIEIVLKIASFIHKYVYFLF